MVAKVEEKILEEAVAYFKQNNGFTRFLKKMQEKYYSFERETPGTVIIGNPTREEKEALSGFMKKDYSRNKNISISLKSFQKRLDETRFSGVTIKEILEQYFGEEIISHKEQKRRESQSLQIFMEKIKRFAKQPKTLEKIETIFSQKGEETARIKKEYRKDKENLERELKKAIRAIEHLPQKQESLPIFAANVNGDPHSLDRNKLAGQLFLKFLLLKEREIEEKNENKNCQKEKQKEISPKAGKSNRKNIRTTEEIAEIYYHNQILIDEMSNMVLTRNLMALKDGQIHKGWQEFYHRHEAMQITLYNLSQIDTIKTNIPKCLIVENPGVFANILQEEDLKEIPIVCTYGQVKLAGIILLKKLLEAGVELYYSGDIDPEGMQIADKLKQRLENHLILVGFDENTYQKNPSNVTLSESRLKKLEGLKDEGLRQTAKLLQQDKVAAYEELNIDYLKEMLRGWKELKNQ